MFLSGLASVLPSWLVKLSIDGLGAMSSGEESFDIIPNQVKSFFPSLELSTDNLYLILPIFIVATFCIEAALKFLHLYNTRKVGLLTVKKLREKVHWHLNKLSLRTQSKYDSGSLVSRITSDLNNLQNWISESMTNTVSDGLKAVFLSVWLLVLDWKLTLISLIILPLFAFPVIKLGKHIRNYSRKGQDYIGSLTTYVAESLQNQRAVKSYNLEKNRQDGFIRESNELYDMQRNWTFYVSLVSPLTNIIGALGIAAILYFGLSSVTSGRISVGEFSSFFVTSILLLDPVKRIGRVSTIVQSALGVAERLFVLLEEEEQKDIEPCSTNIRKESFEGAVEFKDVCYSYSVDNNLKANDANHKEQLFNDLNLKIEARTSVAFVGPSGGGKSTLLGLLPRFNELDSGEIFIDGISIRDLTLHDLRKQVALVTQDPLLFSGTIKENISMGCTKLSDEEINQAAIDAHVMEFAQELKHGLNTDIGERGQNLSVGQRQRVALARAFASKAPIMILDEPTSALDNESEKYIQDSIDKLMQTRTVLIAAHRLHTIKNCDQIAYIEDGQIKESGTHNELFSYGHAYARLLDSKAI